MEQWCKKGYFIVDNLFSSKELHQVLETLDKIKFRNTYDFGSEGGVLEFPCEDQIFNQMTLHPKLIEICQTLLDTRDIRLIQSDIWSKTNDGKNPHNSNQDQRMHMDYPNNYLTHPPVWDKPESVAIIIYYSNSDICEGGTRIVPRLGESDRLYQMPYNNLAGLGDYQFNNDKTITENYFKDHYPDIYTWRKELYDREIGVRFKPGTVLFYRHDVWHRGFPIKLGETRVVQNIGYKKAGCDWITTWNKGWARHLCDYTNKMEVVIRNCNNKQRKCLGIPDIDSSYWDETKRKSMKWRYHSKL